MDTGKTAAMGIPMERRVLTVLQQMDKVLGNPHIFLFFPIFLPYTVSKKF